MRAVARSAVLAVALIACALVPLSIVAAQNGDDEAAIGKVFVLAIAPGQCL